MPLLWTPEFRQSEFAGEIKEDLAKLHDMRHRFDSARFSACIALQMNKECR